VPDGSGEPSYPLGIDAAYKYRYRISSFRRRPTAYAPAARVRRRSIRDASEASSGLDGGRSGDSPGGMLLVVPAALPPDSGLRAGGLLSALRPGLLPSPGLRPARLLSDAGRLPTAYRRSPWTMAAHLQPLLPVSDLPTGK
jgi:hypothetical protein